MAKRFREVSAFIKIPIFSGKLHLIVTTDLWKSRKRRDPIFGRAEPEHYADVPACLVRLRATYGLLFEFDVLTHETIAHEVFHLTQRVMQWHSVRVDPDNHEACAQFHGWATAWVYAQLGRLRLPVRHEDR